jgi:Zn finger protein HypA/HybF involved in hydrogenase expression
MRLTLDPVTLDPAKHPTAVTVGRLVATGYELEVHCLKCAHYVSKPAADWSLQPGDIVPALDGRFRCTRCGSKETTARPNYYRQG